MGFVPIAEDKLSRLRRMSWDELCSRACQEIAKRVDLAVYGSWFGMPAGKLLRPQVRPKFFFETSEAKHRANLIRTHLPEEAHAIVQEANEICQHEFRLLGYDKIAIRKNQGRERGKSAFEKDSRNEVDWHFVPGKTRAPLKPWFKINFLDFASVGDHKLIWELNRHQHLVTLAKAWLLSGDANYATEAVSQWYSWQKANPYPFGVNWASTLEVAFRSLSWLWLKYLLGECSEISLQFQQDLLSGLRVHGRHIERYLSTYFSPNTHLLGEAAGLFFIGTLCPEIHSAGRWRDRGWSILLKEANRQVRADGIYFEQTLYYHVYALDFFLHARTLAAINGVAIPADFDDVIQKMLDFVQTLSLCCPIEGFGDDDGGRVLNPRRNRVECMTDPLALGAALYAGGKYSGARLTEEAIWLLGEEAFRSSEQRQATPVAPSCAFASGGVYVVRDFDPFPQQMMIDAGPQGNGRCGHGHADALSIRFALDGCRMLIDPGTYRYVSDGNERDYFRGTAAHNTLRIDRSDQAIPDGPFAWTSIPHVSVHQWVNGQTFDFFAGSHDGYERLAHPVLHRRFVFHPRGGAWLVRDAALGEGEHELEVFWHFATNIELRRAGASVLAKRACKGSETRALALLFDRKSAWEAEIGEGWMSPVYGAKETAPVLRIHRNRALPQGCVVLMLSTAETSDVGEFAAIEEQNERICGYQYKKTEREEFFFIAEAAKPWSCGEWRCDAQLLYCKIERDRFTHIVLLHGTFAEFRGKRFISGKPQPEVFEWCAASQGRPGFSSDGTQVDETLVHTETSGIRS